MSTNPSTRRIALAALLVSALCLPLFGQPPGQSSDCPPPQALLTSSDAAYSDPMELQNKLEAHDFQTRCIFPTKFSTIFMVEQNGTLVSTIEGEACFNTSRGAIDVVFRPKPQTFTDFKITERRKGNGYLYRFTGTPRVSAGDKFKFGTAARQYYVKHDNYLLIVSDSQLASRLEATLAY
jgi:hypothetical protein